MSRQFKRGRKFTFLDQQDLVNTNITSGVLFAPFHYQIRFQKANHSQDRVRYIIRRKCLSKTKDQL